MADLAAEGIAVRFGGLQALADVSLRVEPGEIAGLIGPNGAGKTTLFDVITGLRRPDAGRVRLGEADITSYPVHRRARLGLARTFQRLELFGTLTAKENVQIALEAHRQGQPLRTIGNRAEELLTQVRLSHVADVPADFLPTGLARLLELARALASQPRFLLLDEPGSGLSTAETEELAGVLRRLAADGMGVLLVEHDMSLVMNVSRHVTVLDFGKVIGHGDAATVQADPAVRAAYLGEPAGEPPSEIAVSTVAAARVASGPAVREPGTDEAAAPALEVDDVHAAYGRIEVVHGVSLRVAPGSVYALVGPNGAGKSTLLRVLSGRMAASGGRVRIDGIDTKLRSARRLARAGVCTLPEGRGIFPNLTVTENLLMFTHRARGLKAADIEERAYDVFPALRQRARQLAGRLSGGEQQMLAFARALTTEPKILLLDELSMGLAPMVVAQLYELLREVVSRRQMAILLVEQFAQTALEVADRAGVMVNGRIVEEGAPTAIEQEMINAYLGGSTTH